MAAIAEELTVTGRPARSTRDRPRRRPGLVIGGLMLVIVLAVGLAWSWSRAVHRIAVIAVGAPISAGQTIQNEDLRIVQVGAGAGVTLIAAARWEEIVGRASAVPLAPGTLLADGMLGAPSTPPAGQAVSAVAVAAGAWPPDLTAGATVTAVVTTAPGQNSTTAADGSPVSLPAGPVVGDRWTATVLAIEPAADARGGAIITLRLAAGDAVDLATAGDIALIQRHPGER